MKICIFGASGNELAKEYFDAARRLGELMAEDGHTLIYGGGSTGLMGACAEGVKARGGKAVGVAPRYFDEGDFLRKDFGEFIFTDTMAERKTLMLDMAEAFIVLPGGTGTMDEFFETLTLKQLGRQPKALVLLDTLGYYEPLYALLRGMVEKGFTGRSALEMVALCPTPEEALTQALRPEDAGARTLADYAK
ncbi:MAG: TIGR00730 family Rossman fold protein [Oscillospiraceae bacterium]|nr:TIGR00730 family Rossman fold protein [Oscillospiraceae bacterium]